MRLVNHVVWEKNAPGNKKLQKIFNREDSGNQDRWNSFYWGFLATVSSAFFAAQWPTTDPVNACLSGLYSTEGRLGFHVPKYIFLMCEEYQVRKTINVFYDLIVFFASLNSIKGVQEWLLNPLQATSSPTEPSLQLP